MGGGSILVFFLNFRIFTYFLKLNNDPTPHSNEFKEASAWLISLLMSSLVTLTPKYDPKLIHGGSVVGVILIIFPNFTPISTYLTIIILGKYNKIPSNVTYVTKMPFSEDVRTQIMGQVASLKGTGCSQKNLNMAPQYR